MDSPEKKLSEIAKREEEILSFWRAQKIFEKSLEQTKGGEPFSFYDGPPFATGVPHYGHILTSAIKDAIPRYQTMRGRNVRRVWGWDCHGLPIENLIEGELGLEHKKDIEEYGIGKFNSAARASVMRYDSLWKEMIPRIGRWIDMEHSYKTMDASYTESVWWAFKTLYEKGLIYQGFKAMQICPRCETTLSNNEVADGYKDITDISVTVKFELKDPKTSHLTPKTYILAWTTTPWTLPGNVALAINSDAVYVKIQNEKRKTKNENSKLKDGETYILAKERIVEILKGEEYEIVEEFKGSELVGKSYKSIFDYYAKNETLVNRENGWKIYGADFVTMDSGTGVVHIAPAFGEDDMVLGKKENLPFVQHIAMDGTMKKEVRDFAGISAKPKAKEKDGHQSTDILIIKHLAGINTLFSKEKIIHAYPHCWRCDTPLLNYATESWFVKVTDLKERLITENAKTKWVPENLRDGRFGKWLEGARDWAISRSRFWGAPIPVWVSKDGSEIKVVGSLKDLASLSTNKPKNTHYVMRHAEALNNVKGILDCAGDPNNHLTEKGKAEVLKTAGTLKTLGIDHIVVSPFLRTRETADILAPLLGVKDVAIDDRLREINLGIFDGKLIDSFLKEEGRLEFLRFSHRAEGGETHEEVQDRMMACLYEEEKKHKGKTILYITHGGTARMMIAGACLATEEEVLSDEATDYPKMYLKNGEIKKLELLLAPRDETGKINLHRPYIDEVLLLNSKGETMSRVPYVFDCWFESGSMPYAQFHYPFENKELFERNFPADFIGEGIDQTRGWFYNMLNLSVGLFGKAPFKNVLVNGFVLAEDGQKMSKRLKNYPDILDIINRYGADALRYYLLSSPVTRAEDLAFSEKGIDEVVKKVMMRLLNVLSFYELHHTRKGESKNTEKNILDQWILARLAELGNEMTASLNKYEFDRAIKPIGLFVDDLSTWYLRRSRERFKSDDVDERTQAIETTRTVFLEFSKLIAPIMPFIAEHIYMKVGGEKESVHLDSWPVFNESKQAVLLEMKEVRQIVSLALEIRAKEGIKVRQPLQSLKVKDKKIKEEYYEIIKDEVNVKEVALDETLAGEVFLDTIITPELKREGQFRELSRTVQELRKTIGLTPQDKAILFIKTGDAGRSLVEDFRNELKRISLLKEIVFKDVLGEPVDIDGILFTIALIK